MKTTVAIEDREKLIELGIDADKIDLLVSLMDQAKDADVVAQERSDMINNLRVEYILNGNTGTVSYTLCDSAVIKEGVLRLFSNNELIQSFHINELDYYYIKNKT